MAATLTFDDYKYVSERLKCEIAAVMAVAKVEAPKGGFNSDGSLTVLFEPHIFWRELVNLGVNPNTVLEGNRDILSSVWNKALYPSNYKGVYKQILKAQSLSIEKVTKEQIFEAVARSCSWGKFQVLGRNYRDLGFKSAIQLVDFLQLSEKNHLIVFCAFLEIKKLDIKLRLKDWDGFALGYNGKSYKVNKYHIKLKATYNSLKLMDLE